MRKRLSSLVNTSAEVENLFAICRVPTADDAFGSPGWIAATSEHAVLAEEASQSYRASLRVPTLTASPADDPDKEGCSCKERR